MRIEKDENGYIVDDDETLVYGTGETVFDAIDDYIKSLVEYCIILLERTREL